jgi:glycosyltransferase involved in cell wall biosynthesis
MVTYNKLDGNFSRAAARRAAQTRSHLFLYSPYAWEAFRSSYPHTPRKVLFQYHPHPGLEKRILAADRARFPQVGESWTGKSNGLLPEALAQRDRDAWKHADLIFCASAFTKRSLLEAGCDEKFCRVVPYGIDLPTAGAISTAPDAFRPVFVGAGGPRKGIHHLLLAWRQARLPEGSCLTLVCRAIDREVERMAEATPNVKLVRGVTAEQLNETYAQSALFVMPSLVEGFGQVYLEALAQGCPTLGTANTCLPDLGGESDGVFLVTPGKIEELTAKLEALAQTLPGNSAIRKAARACAERFTWQAFRQGLRQALKN